jgi:hypothetical protein
MFRLVIVAKGISMERALSEAEKAVAAVKRIRSEHYANGTIHHYECKDIDPDLAFRAIMGVALARAYLASA